jgi:hypothetical protein
MAFLFTPGGHYLRHDAGEVCMHDSRPECIGGAFAYKIDNANPELFH